MLKVVTLRLASRENRPRLLRVACTRGGIQTTLTTCAPLGGVEGGPSGGAWPHNAKDERASDSRGYGPTTERNSRRRT